MKNQKKNPEKKQNISEKTIQKNQKRKIENKQNQLGAAQPGFPKKTLWQRRQHCRADKGYRFV